MIYPLAAPSQGIDLMDHEKPATTGWPAHHAREGRHWCKPSHCRYEVLHPSSIRQSRQHCHRRHSCCRQMRSADRPVAVTFMSPVCLLSSGRVVRRRRPPSPLRVRLSARRSHHEARPSIHRPPTDRPAARAGQCPCASPGQCIYSLAYGTNCLCRPWSHAGQRRAMAADSPGRRERRIRGTDEAVAQRDSLHVVAGLPERHDTTAAGGAVQL